MFINYDRMFTKLQVYNTDNKLIHNITLDKEKLFRELYVSSSENIISSKLLGETLRIRLTEYKHLDIDLQHTFTIYFYVR